MITVTVTGPKGAGKTTVALSLYQMLKRGGHEVAIKGHSPEHSKMLEFEAVEDLRREKLNVLIDDSRGSTGK